MARISTQWRKAGRLLIDRMGHWRFQVAAMLHLPGTYKRYWDSRAREIDAAWGQARDDFPVLAEIIRKIAPRSLLDIGCGSGRLFPLYLQLQVEEIVGQDISGEALQIAGEHCSSPQITLTGCPLLQLAYPAGYFDLIVSNRVLQHIPGSRIHKVVGKLAELGKSVYLNEAIKDDPLGETFYLFKHDYQQLFGACGLTAMQQGTIGAQHWSVFGAARPLPGS